MKDHKREKIASALREAAGDFISRTKTRKDMITATSVRLSNDLSRAEIRVTVFPDTNEDAIVKDLNRKRGAFAAYLKANTRVSIIPLLSFAVDEGEKNRQNIDSLSQNS